MLFEFELKPVNGIEGWFRPASGTKHLSWFGFTLGYYRMNLGSEKLLNSSDETVAYYRQVAPSANTGTYLDSYVDYQIARFYEDCLELLPYALEPVPENLRDYIELEYETLRRWRLPWTDLTDKFDKEEKNKFFDALDWVTNDRYLTGGHITPYNILFWSDGQNMNIYWNNQEIYSHKDVPAWSAQKGKFKLPINQYLDEVKSFHNRLFEQMEQRIDDVCKKWERTDVIVDCEVMKTEHRQRAERFVQILATPPHKTDWNRVGECLSWLQKL